MKNLDDDQFGTIRRELYIDAPPETVFDVISQPEHMVEWWADSATYEVRPGSSGQISFGDPDAGGKIVTLTVLAVEFPRTFSFRWTHDADESPGAGNSLLVTFDLVASGSGTLVRFAETGFRELDAEVAELEAMFRDHVSGWNHFLPRIAPRAESVVSRS